MKIKFATKCAQILGVSLLSFGFVSVVDSRPATAQVCNVFGCSQPGAGECNPFGCPNPGAGACTPFGCPASPQNPTQNPQNPAQNPPANQARLNVNGTPSYGSVRLRAGFTPDPYTVSVVAGGETDATNLQLGRNCVGFVAAGQPDFRVRYEAGSYPLSFFVESSEDTTLIINGPNGEWYCNDDYNGTNPQVRLSRPTSGQYDIWVGTYGSISKPQATLSVTEY